MSIIQNVVQEVEDLNKKIDFFILKNLPLIGILSPKSAIILKEIDVAIGIINYLASRSASVEHQASLTTLATALSNDPVKAKAFLDNVLLGANIAIPAPAEATKSPQPIAADSTHSFASSGGDI